MQSYPPYFIDRPYINDYPTRRYPVYKPESNNKMTKRSVIILLITAVILSLVLIVSIILIFTIGLKTAQRTINPGSSQFINASVSSLYEPCTCGCPSTEPLFSDETKTFPRIINGETARAHSWPWQTLLLVFDANKEPISFCGATFITERHVLTAAHCVHRFFPPFIFIFPGQHIFNPNLSLTSGYPVKKIYIHEGFNALLHDDIAILTIEQPLRFDSYIHPIYLAKPSSTLLQAQEELIGIGWGRITAQPGTNIYARSLQQVKLTYIPTSHPNCSEIFRPVTSVHPGQMCAGKPGYNACQGDSGGPLMRRIRKPNTETYYWQQIGISSKTIDCGWNSTWPEIYTNVPYYYDWIMATIKRTA